MTEPTLLNPGIRYRVTRNVAAEDSFGQPCRIALVSVEYVNGWQDTFVIPEGLIQFAGEGIIEDEVRRFVSKR